MTEFDASVRPSLQRLSTELQFHKKLVVNGLLRSCIACEHWNKKDEVCRLYNMRPPAETIVIGCESYVWDIPF